MTFWAVPALLILISLGVWQIQRLNEKEALLASIAERMTALEAPLDEVLRLPIVETEWRHVRARGRFLHDKEAYVHAIEPELGLGVHVLTPLEMDDGGAVLVDRGNRELPIKADFVGKELSTGLEERVDVTWREDGAAADAVRVVKV